MKNTPELKYIAFAQHTLSKYWFIRQRAFIEIRRRSLESTNVEVLNVITVLNVIKS